MTEPILSVAVARALHLAAQGMLQPRRTRATKDDVLAAIRRMGVLQIDIISVVARSPYLVLWSRLGDYDPTGSTSCWPRAGRSSIGRTSLVRDLAAALVRCACWHGCPQVVLAQAEPAGIAAPLAIALGQAPGAVLAAD